MRTCIVLSLLLLTFTLQAANKTTAGEFITERPTLISLGFEWHIDGDDNHNASASVFYRKKGETAWKEGLPMLRMDHERINENSLQYIVPNMFAGSIFDLEPGTDYECRLVLADPDGVDGKAENIVTVHTRPEPMPAAGGKVYHVYPPGFNGQKQEPAFTGLQAAYYTGGNGADYFNSYPPRVQPGDIILVHAGLYKDDRYRYGAPLGGISSGTYFLTQSGTADKPIVIKAAGDGEPIFDGDGAYNLFNLMAANYHYFEGLTVRNTNVAFLLGIKNIAGASGFTLKRSRVENVGRGVHDDWSGSKNFYIADNVFIGRHDRDKMMGWNGAPWDKLPGFPEPLDSEYAIKVYGQGHVVAHNYIANWHDGVDMATYGNPDGTPRPIADRFPMSVDFYENDITNMGDNCIETDGGGRNMRVFRNRCANTAAQGLSAQPIFGGPVYFIRNIVYNGPGSGSLKLVSTPSGILAYNNTFVGEIAAPGPAANEHFRNNLILAQGAAGPVFAVGTFTNYSSSDYNGFAPNAGAEVSFQWSSPPFDKRADYAAAPVARSFRTLAEYQKATGQDLHSRLVGYDVLVNAPKPDAKDPQRIYDVRPLDFGLRKRSAAVDAGTVLPNVTDGFTGRAPDLGALELGQAVPHYGPPADVTRP